MKLTNFRDIVLQVLGEALIFTLLYYSTNFFPGPHFHSPLAHYSKMTKISLFDAFYYSLTTQGIEFLNELDITWIQLAKAVRLTTKTKKDEQDN